MIRCRSLLSHRLLSIVTAVVLSPFLLGDTPPSKPVFSLVYEGDEGGYAVVRTPQILVTKTGTILAFAQGRSGNHDQSDNDILVKRSTDGGKTWSKLQVIADQGKDALNSICVVQHRDTGRILVIGCSFPFGYEQREFKYLSPAMQAYQKERGRENNPVVKPGFEGKDVARSYLVHSDDDGKTWSPMRDVTAMVKHPAPSLASVPGPGVAVQMTAGPHAGRIVVPCWNRYLDTKRTSPDYDVRPYAVWSDDGGATWSRGELAPQGSTSTTRSGNESQLVELSGGRLLMNSRSVGRITTISSDGGKTWSPLVDEPVLVGTGTAAGFIRYDPIGEKDKGRLIFSHPAEPGRIKGVLYLSPDEGKTWPVKRTLREGRFSYSGLARLPEGDIGCLFDGVAEPAEFGGKRRPAVLFARVPMAWLANSD